MCLPQQCGVVCAAHGEGGGGAAVAEGERCAARTEGCNIGEGEVQLSVEKTTVSMFSERRSVKSERTPCSRPCRSSAPDGR